MSGRFKRKAPDETVLLQFDFSPLLATGETLSTVNSLGVVTAFGVDQNPSTVKQGNPSINAGTSVMQYATAGVDGCEYEFEALASTSLGQVLSVVGVLPVRSV